MKNTTALKKRIGRRTRAGRAAAGLTQLELASRLSVTRGQVEAIELGRTLPSVGVLRNLCRVLGLSADWLLGNEPPLDATRGQA